MAEDSKEPTPAIDEAAQQGAAQQGAAQDAALPVSSSPRRLVTGRRRALAMVLSFIWPGAGQAYRGEPLRGVVHAVPIAILAMAALVTLLALGPLVLVVHLLNPTVAGLLGVAVVIAGTLRIWSLIDAGPPNTTRLQVWAVVLASIVVLTHAWVGASLLSFYRAGQQLSEPIIIGGAPSSTPAPDITLSPGQTPGPPSTPGPDPMPTPRPQPSILPGERERVTILFVGADNTHSVERGLTDTLMVASFDPGTQDLVMISIPRDTARFPLYNGGEYPSRINTFMRAAAAEPERFPDGPMAALINEVAYLVGVPIDYYALIDIAGFQGLVDAVGGVDVEVERAVDDPGYQFSPTEVGFQLDPGPVHLDGKYATAFVRSRHGSSDYDRARRQQQVLLALRAKLNDPAVLLNLPNVVDAVAQIIRTDAPLDRLPEIVSIVQNSSAADARRYVLSPPDFAHRVTRADGTLSFATQLDLDAVGRLSVELFGDLSRYAPLQ